MKENMMDGFNIDGEMEKTEPNLRSFRLGNNFSDFILDALNEKIENLDYYGALELLETIGLNKDESLGVLFGDYEIVNTENEIIVADNFSEPKLNLYQPIENFINDYLFSYKDILERTSYTIGRDFYIDIYNTPDENLPILSKYFTIDFNYLIMNPSSRGIIEITGIKFYDAIYTAYKNGEDYENLLESLSQLYNIELLKYSFDDYFESRNILNIWNKIKNCITFLDSYDSLYNSRPLLNKISGITEAFSKVYELITDETRYYNVIYDYSL